ncbi:MAG: DNA-directed RNA polymerase subunit K [Candidatus Hodarchaeales archaeon]|jgi:DNA-directed RNA polymerase subunit K/omega
MASNSDMIIGEEPSPDDIVKLIKIGPPILTKFERARILGTRALQISMSAPVLVDLDEQDDVSDPLLIANVEMDKKVLPISVRRVLPDGRYQDIPFRWLTLKTRERKQDRKKKSLLDA